MRIDRLRLELPAIACGVAIFDRIQCRRFQQFDAVKDGGFFGCCDIEQPDDFLDVAGSDSNRLPCNGILPVATSEDSHRVFIGCE